MKKIITLVFASAMLVSAAACSNTTTASSAPTSQTATAVSSVAEVSSALATPTTASTLGIPSWVYGSATSNNVTSSMLIQVLNGNVYGYSLTEDAKSETLLAEADDVYQYSAPTVYGEEVYALKSPVTGEGKTQFVSVYTPEGTTPTFKDITFSTNNIALPALIGENLYYINLETHKIIQMDAKTGTETEIYTDENKALDHFVYDENNLYFQLTGQEGVPSVSPEALKTVYRINLKDPTKVETATLTEAYELQFVNDGQLYFETQPEVSDGDSAPTTYATGKWNEAPSPLLTTLKDEQKLLAFQPYEEGYAVSSMNQDGTTYYFALYDETGTYVKDLFTPLIVDQNDDSANATINAFGNVLIYTEDQTSAETGELTTKTIVKEANGKDITVPAAPSSTVSEGSSEVSEVVSE